MIKVLLLDVDGVVIRGEQFATHLEQQYGISREEASAFFHGEFEECLIGKADLKAVLPKHLQQWGWKHSVDEFIEQWFTSESRMDPQLVQYIQQCRKKGIQCFAATNQEKYRHAYLMDTLHFGRFFDGIFCSWFMGCTKRSEHFFAQIVQALPTVRKREILFWDDTPTHVEVARTFGIHAEVYTTFTQCRLITQQYIS